MTPINPQLIRPAPDPVVDIDKIVIPGIKPRGSWKQQARVKYGKKAKEVVG